jgi:hypothetical protein
MGYAMAPSALVAHLAIGRFAQVIIWVSRNCLRGIPTLPIHVAPDLILLIYAASRVAARSVTSVGVSKESGVPEPLSHWPVGTSLDGLFRGELEIYAHAF